MTRYPLHLDDPRARTSRVEAGDIVRRPELRFPLSADPGAPPPERDRTSADPSTAGTGAAEGDAADDPGVGEAVGRARAGVLRLVTAHMELLKAELAVTGHDLAIILGMVVAALCFVVVALLLI
ncbi:MAG: phage holin family protein, partial [Chloroflexi bacterium]|nr:phage holin family protein [Chloroflexota bacterium]